MNVNAESLAEVQALLTVRSWVLMDEEQRDKLMAEVIAPRWGMTTSDGVVLKGTVWAELTGATSASIKDRYYRIVAAQRRAENETNDARSEPTTAQRSSIRSAGSAIRKHPTLAAELLNDPEVGHTFEDAVEALQSLRLPHLTNGEKFLDLCDSAKRYWDLKRDQFTEEDHEHIQIGTDLIACIRMEWENR